MIIPNNTSVAKEELQEPNSLKRSGRKTRPKPSPRKAYLQPPVSLDATLTTATSLSSSSPTSVVTSPSSNPSSPSITSSEEDGGVNKKLLPLNNFNNNVNNHYNNNNDMPTDEIPKLTSFKYADKLDIANVTLRKGCLQPEQEQNTSSPQVSQKQQLARIPYATMQRRIRNSAINFFDPLESVQEGQEDSGNKEEGQIILLPASDSIPDILQTLSSTSKGTNPNLKHCLSLTRSGQIPRDVMALYAKVEKGNGGDKGVIVNELSNLIDDSSIEGGSSNNGSHNNKVLFPSSNTTISQPNNQTFRGNEVNNQHMSSASNESSALSQKSANISLVGESTTVAGNSNSTQCNQQTFWIFWYIITNCATVLVAVLLDITTIIAVIGVLRKPFYYIPELDDYTLLPRTPQIRLYLES